MRRTGEVSAAAAVGVLTNRKIHPAKRNSCTHVGPTRAPTWDRERKCSRFKASGRVFRPHLDCVPVTVGVYIGYPCT